MALVGGEMSRCSVCDFPLKLGSFTCVACSMGFCSHHARRMGAADLLCCDSCLRECSGCLQAFPKSEGVHLRGEFFCGKCWGSGVIGKEREMVA